MAAHAEERSNDKESEKSPQMDKHAQLTNAYYLPPCSQASLHKAQREAARFSNEPVINHHVVINYVHYQTPTMT